MVALAAVGTLVGKEDAMDREAVDMAILGRGQARVQRKRFPTSYPANGSSCTYSACLYLKVHILTFLGPHILQPPQEQQLCLWKGRQEIMEPGC